jgi:hypothetical protein
MDPKVVGGIAVAVVAVLLLPLAASLVSDNGGLGGPGVSDDYTILWPGETFTEGAMKVTFVGVAFGEKFDSDAVQYVYYDITAQNVSDQVLDPNAVETEPEPYDAPDFNLIIYPGKTLLSIGMDWRTAEGTRFTLGGGSGDSKHEPLPPGETIRWRYSQAYEFFPEGEHFISQPFSVMTGPSGEHFPFRIQFRRDQLQEPY